MDKVFGTITATKDQLNSIGVEYIDNGAMVEVYEKNEYQSIYGLCSKIKYEYHNFDYIIPTDWIKFE